MKRTKGIYLALLSMMLSPIAAHADPVTVGANEWMQPLDTVGNSWTDFSEVCDTTTGICTGSAPIGGVDLNGWTWASSEEVGDLLFAQLTPSHPGGLFNLVETDSVWAPAIMALFEPTFLPNIYTQGLTRSQFGGSVGAAIIYDNTPGRDDQLANSVGTSPAIRFSFQGGWFYRATPDTEPNPVPEPTTLALLGLGLAGMSMTRRKKKV